MPIFSVLSSLFNTNDVRGLIVDVKPANNVFSDSAAIQTNVLPLLALAGVAGKALVGYGARVSACGRGFALLLTSL